MVAAARRVALTPRAPAALRPVGAWAQASMRYATLTTTAPAVLAPMHLVTRARTLTTPAQGGTAGTAELLRIQRALADSFGSDAVELDEASNKLSLDLGAEKGVYVIMREPRTSTHPERLCLASPVSGARWYVYDVPHKAWVSPDDGHHLIELFVRELVHSTARYIDL